MPDIAPGDGRAETENERLDRNWNSLLQEVRVTQTGTQILSGFLLAVAFQPRFALLDQYQVTLYLILVSVAALTTAIGLAPVSLHRILFRRHAMARVVRVASILVRATLIGVAAVLTGTVLLIFDVVARQGRRLDQRWRDARDHRRDLECGSGPDTTAATNTNTNRADELPEVVAPGYARSSD